MIVTVVAVDLRFKPRRRQQRTKRCLRACGARTASDAISKTIDVQSLEGAFHFCYTIN